MGMFYLGFGVGDNAGFLDRMELIIIVSCFQIVKSINNLMKWNKSMWEY